MPSTPRGTQAIPSASFYGPGSSRSTQLHPTTPARHPSASEPQSTPVVPKHGTSRKYTTLHFERSPAMRQLGAEMARKFVGPMPVKEFLDDFLPRAPQPLPWKSKSEVGKPSSKDAFSVVSQRQYEDEMYQPFITAATPFCPSLELVDTHNHSDSKSDLLKPDVAAYMKGCRPRSVVTDFATMEMHLEFKIKDADDAFRDWKKGDKHAFERDTEQGKDTKGQITTYAAANLDFQFRTFVYSVLVFGNARDGTARTAGGTARTAGGTARTAGGTARTAGGTARTAGGTARTAGGPKDHETRVRLLRWDRSGAIVTEAFPLDAEDLAEFFWRFSHLSPEDRGVDSSVSPAREEDAKAARKALHLPENKPMLQLVANNGDADGLEGRFIVQKPSYSFRPSLTGRSTRGFVAYDPFHDTVGFLKDTWRYDVEGMEREGKIYQTLNSLKIPHIAQCLLSGDMPEHVTRTQDFVLKPWVCDSAKPKELVRHRHYRLFLDAVGSHLDSFESTRELVVAVGDAFEAHKMAYEQAKILHRDISMGNVLIDKHGRGLLIDWDFSKPLSEKDERPRREERTGTWQFMAARLLLAESDEGIQHTLQDDMESFVHVLGWVALRFIHNDLDPSELSAILTNIFDFAFVERGGRVRGGNNKKSALLENEIAELVAPHIPRFRQLLHDLTKVCSVRYMKPPAQDQIQVYKELTERNDPIIAAILKVTSVRTYLQGIERVQNSEWMLGLLRDAVGDSEASHWAKGDKAVKNEVLDLSGDPGMRKRKPNTDLRSDLLPAKRLRHSDPEQSSESSSKAESG